MSRILITWELGAGWGHVVPALAIIERLKSRGHEVVFAVHNLALAELAERRGAKCIACPSAGGRRANEIYPTENYAQVLHNSGFGERDVLRRLVKEWRVVFDDERPDFVLCDHSPTALVALRTTSIRRAIIGIGFCCPPASAFDSLLLEDCAVPADRAEETRILENANHVLAQHLAQPLAHMAALFEEVDDTFLMTYAELDHFPRRLVPKYYGSLSVRLGEPVEWPESPFPKVFVYSRAFPAFEALLQYINRSQLSAIVYSEGVVPSASDAGTRGRIQFLSRPFDLEQVAATCDLAITNGNHGTTAAMLLAGKPLLVIPTVAEQYMLGQRVQELGAGLLGRPDDPDGVIGGLLRLLRDKSITHGARLFGAKYAGQKSERVIEQMVSCIEQRV